MVTVWDHKYVYYDDLLALDSCRELLGTGAVVISRDILTPLIWQSWAQELVGHPDQAFTNFILSGISNGFRIGFGRHQSLELAGRNLHCPRPSLVSEYLSREVQLGRMWKLPFGVFPKGIHLSPIGLIPKKNKPGKWRLIVDLSSPFEHSINDGISQERSSLSYTSVDHLAALIVSEGQGSFLVKADVKEAYRMVPIHPEDQHLLGVQWNGAIYVDRMLPFGLRSAPKLFSALADAVQWMLKRKGISKGIHYLDDFVLVAGSRVAADRQKSTLLWLFEHLGIPIEPAKLEGPSTCLTFLGIEVDTASFQLRLPEAKLSELMGCLQQCVHRRSVRKHDLEHLTGLLQFATKVVRPGRPFLKRLYALQGVGSHPDHLVRLSVPAQADIAWWLLFTDKWNGISLLWDLGLTRVDIYVHSDASGSWGCGAVQDLQWLQLEWPPGLCHLSIAIKELIPVVLAAATFGKSWSGKSIQFVVDNEAVVAVLNSTFCSDLYLMHLIRLLVFFAARFDFWFSAIHIPGQLNSTADAISRNRLDLFFTEVPQAASTPAPVSPSLVRLVSQCTSWISPSWIELFKEASAGI